MDDNRDVAFCHQVLKGGQQVDIAVACKLFGSISEESRVPTANYLSGMPELPDHLEAGLEALGIDVTNAEDHFRDS